MKIATTVFLITFIAAPSFTALHANTGAEQLGSCLVDSMTGKERKKIAKWLFFAMSAHPELSTYASIENPDITESDNFVGTLITRLLTEDCPQQYKTASNEVGSQAMVSAFELVGRVAMQELMTDTRVTNSIGAFEKYLDKDKINNVLAK